MRALAREEPIEGYLAEAGDTQPERAARAFRRVALHLDLGRHLEHWAPSLLGTARPGFAAECLEDLARGYRERRQAPLPIEKMPALPLLLGSSSFLARLLLRQPDWVDDLIGQPPNVPCEMPGPDWDEIRAAKYRGLLRIAARDLCGRPFASSLQELSELAEGCLRAALDCAVRETGVAAPVLFALGKLGGQELNFSSDVDLLFVYEPASQHDDLATNQEVGRLIRHFKGRLEQPAGMGFAYRVDLDLRPEGPTGVLANSVEAALSYYENFGAEWERQALLRLRYVAGPRDVAQRFGEGIVPFLYRRSIGLDVLRGVHAMKCRIEEERRRAGRDLENDLKEGPGGIRDVEFLVQALQLLYGGREPEVRTGNVLTALEKLARAGALAAKSAVALQEAYLWLRRAEHSLQLEEERQTRHVPREEGAQVALARRMGYREPSGKRARAHWLEDWESARSRVRSEFEALVLRTDL